MSTFIKKTLSIILITVLLLSIPCNTVYAWSLKTNNYSANLILKEILDSNGKVTIDPYGTFDVDSELYSAIKKYPNAFRAGSLGADSYPDIYVGQGYIQSGDDLSSGQWLKRMVDDALSLPEESDKRYEITSFMLGFMNYYSQEMFGNTYTNQVATGEYPDFSELTNVNTAPRAIERLTKYIAAEKYIDSKIPDSYLSGDKIQIDAPNDFVLDSLLFNGSKGRGISDKYLGDAPYHYKYLIELRSFVKEKADYFRAYGNASNVFDYAANTVISGYLDAWLEDIDAAIDEWINVSENIAKDMLESGNSTDLTIAIDRIMEWFDTHGKYITPVPDVLIDAMNLKGDIVTYFKDELGITALSSLYDEFEAYIQELILDFFLYNVMGLSSNQIDQMKNAFSYPALVLGEKNIAQLDEDLGNFGTSHDVDSQEFTPFYNALTMTKLVLIGPDGYKNLINKVKNVSNTKYNKSIGEAMVDNLKVGIKTADPLGPDGAGTDDDVYFGVKFTDGTTTKTLCDKSGYNDFESGNYDTYNIPLNRKVKLSEIDSFFLQKKDVPLLVGGDWDPEYFKATAYLGSVEIKYLGKTGLGTYEDENPKYYSFDGEGTTYSSSLNSGLFDYITSLSSSMEWKDNNFILWNDSELREDIFYKIFKDIEKYDNPNFDPFVFIDILPPEVVDISKNPSDWNNDDVIVTYNVVDSFKGVNEVKFSKGDKELDYFTTNNGGEIIIDYIFTAKENGIWTVYANDKEGNEAVYNINVNNIDLIDPLLSSVTINNDDDFTNTNSVTVNIDASDDLSGVKYMEVSNNEDFSGSQVIPYKQNYSYNLDNTSGNKKLYVRVYDAAMNVSTVMSDEIMLDIEYPSVDVKMVAANEYSNDHKDINIIINEQYSGIKEVSYVVDSKVDGKVSLVPNKTRLVENNAQFEAYDNVFYTVYVEDNAGNITAKSVEVDRIDRIKPTVNYATFEYNFRPTQKSVEIDIFAEDSDAGIDQTYFSTDGKTFLRANKSFIINTEMNGPVYIKATDKAGNERTITTKDVIVDRTSPQYSYKVLSDEEYVSGKVQVVVTGKDSSGIMSIEKVGGNKANTQVGIFTHEDDDFVDYIITDKAGNETKAKISAAVIDNEPPSKPSIITSPKTYDSEDVLIEGFEIDIAEGYDEKSGTIETLYSINNGVYKSYVNKLEYSIPGEYTIKAKSIDAAGNESQVASEFIKVEENKVVEDEKMDKMLEEIGEIDLSDEVARDIKEIIKKALLGTNVMTVGSSLNSKSAEIVINISDILDNLESTINKILYDEYNSSEVVAKSDFNMNIKLVDKTTKEVIYSKNNIKGGEIVNIENLKDSSEYQINMILVYKGKIVATRQVSRRTPDRTPPKIMKVTIKNGLLTVLADDQTGLPDKPFKFIVYKSNSSLKDNTRRIDNFMAQESESSEEWTNDPTVTDLELGDRVIVMIRDKEGNEIYEEINIVTIDGNLYENLNGNNPLILIKGTEVAKEDIINIAIDYHNENENDSIDKGSLVYDNYSIETDSKFVSFTDELNIKADSVGDAYVVIENLNDHSRYVLFLNVNNTYVEAKSVWLKLEDEKSLTDLFSNYLLAEFGRTKDIEYSSDNNNIDIKEDVITVNDATVAKIKAQYKNKETYLYVIAKNESEYEKAEYAEVNLAYTIKKGQTIKSNESLIEYANNNTVISQNPIFFEFKDDEILEAKDDNTVYAKQSGVTTLTIYSPISNIEVSIEIKVEDLNGNDITYEDMDEEYWAKEYIYSVANKGIITIEQDFKPKEGISFKDFLVVLDKAKMYLGKEIYNVRNNDDISYPKDDTSIFNIKSILSSISEESLFYIFEGEIDYNREITRGEVAHILAELFDLKESENELYFSDLSVDSKYYDSIKKMIENEVFIGYPDGEFKSNNKITKEQIAVIINRLIV